MQTKSEIVLFKSKLHPKCTMNRYGIVFCVGHVMVASVRDEVQREAHAAGWRLVRSDNLDVGFVWIPTENPPTPFAAVARRAF